MKKRRFVRRLILISAVFLAALVLMGTVFLATRGDYRFILEQKWYSLTHSAKAESVQPPTRNVSWDALKTMPNVTLSDALMLINESHLIDDAYQPDLTTYKDTVFAASVLEPYCQLVETVREKFDLPLYIRSSYRSAEEQQEIYQDSAANVAAVVGASEHQTGLALDVFVPGYAGSSFPKCEAGRFVNRYCYEYGFIIRYPHGKSDITGITYEPWHLRYVGAPHAELITLNSLTLEEYITEFLKPDEFYSFHGYLICRTAMDETIPIPETYGSIVVSPDNTGYVILTVSPSVGS